jgi:type IV secretion system protein VirB10
MTKPIILGVGISVGVLAIGWSYWSEANKSDPDPIKPPPASLGQVVPTERVVVTPPAPPPAPPAPTFKWPENGTPSQINPFGPAGGLGVSQLPPTPTPTPTPTPQRDQPPPAPRAAAAAGPAYVPHPYMMSYATPTPSSAPASAAPEEGVPSLRPAGAAAPVNPVSYKASRLEGQNAALMGDQTFVLPRGIVPCQLDTEINSTLPGDIQCHIPIDIVRHGVTLINRGAIVHGKYSNSITTGQVRLSIAAEDMVDDATGCFVQFPSAPFSTPTGATGIPGSVDRHIAERIGPAVVLALTQSSINLAQTLLTKGGNTYLSFGNSGGGNGLEQIATEDLRSKANIQATISLPEGTMVAVYINKPLNFANCYSLALKDH